MSFRALIAAGVAQETFAANGRESESTIYDPLPAILNPQSSASRPFRQVLGCILGALLFVGVPAAWARDAFVMLSGGGSPLGNNYSQYLQARAVAKYFQDNYPADSVWTFFGAGNVEGEAAFIADVRKQYKKDGLILESWLPGPLPNNRPAKREEFLRALKEEILPAVQDGGTLFLFVGDHGSQASGDTYDTTIDLWGIDPDPTSERKWKFVNHEKLTSADLQEALAAGLGRGRVVFCMTQCYSGGFHFVGIPRHVRANPNWFVTMVPVWAMPEEEAGLPLAAGYTATDYYSLAAGCDPDPDPDKWAGYERFVPENLLGLDLFTLEPAGKRRKSFHDAHVEATLVDRTIDKPHSTSERYLERWASLIETKLAKENDLAPAVKDAVARYQRAVDTGRISSRDRALNDRRKLFAKYTKRLTEQAPSAKTQILKGSRADLEKLAGPLPAAASFTVPPRRSNSSGGSNSSRTPTNRELWREKIFPAWKKAVEAGEISALQDSHALAFEQTLIGEDEKGRDLLFGGGWRSPLLPHLFWSTGANDPATMDPEKAEAIARWGAQRRRTIVEWAKASSDADVKAAAEKAFPPPRPRNNAAVTRPNAAPNRSAVTATKTQSTRTGSNLSSRPLQPKIAAERALFYRRVLAAWAFLDEVNETSALDRVAQLTALERTPLPRSTR